MNNIHFETIKNVLTREELFEIVEYFEENKLSDPLDVRTGYKHESLMLLNMHAANRDDKELFDSVDPRVLPLIKVLSTCEDYFIKTFEIQNKLEYKRGFLNEMSLGAFLAKHS